MFMPLKKSVRCLNIQIAFLYFLFYFYFYITVTCLVVIFAYSSQSGDEARKYLAHFQKQLEN